MILEEIEAKLKGIDSRIYYGAAKSEVQDKDWNYIVFHRSNFKKSKNKTSFSDYYTVTIVREDFIPEGIAEQVIDKMEEIPGMRFTETDGEYDYARKPKTDMVVELLSLEFVKARK